MWRLIFHFVWWKRQTKIWLSQRKTPKIVLGVSAFSSSASASEIVCFWQKTGNDGSCPENRLVARSKSALSSIRRVCHYYWGASCWGRRYSDKMHHILFSPTILLPETRMLGNEIFRFRWATRYLDGRGFFVQHEAQDLSSLRHQLLWNNYLTLPKSVTGQT